MPTVVTFDPFVTMFHKWTNRKLCELQAAAVAALRSLVCCQASSKSMLIYKTSKKNVK